MHLVFDANLPHNLSKGLAILEGGNRKSPNPAMVGHVYDFMPQDATDAQIIIKSWSNAMDNNYSRFRIWQN